MTYEERLQYNGKMFGLPFFAFLGLVIYALVRGPYRLLLPQALIDMLYPYALLPWERPFAEGLDLFHQQFVVLALIGAITQASIGLPVILPYMPEMKALPNIRRSIVLGPIAVSCYIIMRAYFMCVMNGVFHVDEYNFRLLVIKLISPAMLAIITWIIVVMIYSLILNMKIYNYEN